MRREAGVVLAAVLLVLSGCGVSADADPLPTGAGSDAVLDVGPRTAFVDAGPDGAHLQDGDDWTLPDWVRPAENSGLFSEEASPDDLVAVRSVDVSWRQLQPEKGGALDRVATGEAQGMSFEGLDAQLREPGDFWMRIFASGEDWAPEWVAEDCGVGAYGPDYDGQRHLPIWDECVWGHLMDTYRALFVDAGLAADPRLRFVYVPGAFTWAEYDYEMISAAVESGDLDEETYLRWYGHAWSDLVELFGDNARKLVFTGEDYPWGPFGEADDLLARQAVDAGMGVRTGITELANFHLSEAPAYGSSIQPDGHLVVDESLPIHSGRYVVATENECYNDCGYQSSDPYYSVRQSNLKALQLRMNWMYVVPGPSYLAEYAEHWDWVRLELGQKAETSPDAWAAFRDAEDRYWADEEFPRQWRDRPWVRNLERWLVQVDEPGSVAHRTDVDTHEGDLEEDNGIAHEGLSTAVADGDTGFVLSVDPRFATASDGHRTVLKVTFLDTGDGAFAIDTDAGSSVAVPRTGSGEWRTATVALPDGAVGEDATRLRISLSDGADDLVVRFVRLVRTAASAA
ncbi:hypothetical protein Q9R19_00390 [Microbacterium sp. ARD32]|uniref:hypothetical protein n=1 Tax=Microbacterium sp. ARD32 TaxID=2962577 RepID=UPI002881E191|nr:hypothetical protein [Microbacterium sp. ARD32]MDT0156078.1 hypothetical protein [Microbacterium sp. ARD32]